MRQAVSEESISTAPKEAKSVEEEQVVIYVKDGDRVKGYLQVENPKDLNSLFERSQASFPGDVKILSAEDRSPIEIDAQGFEAIFFVKSFAGNRAHEVLRYYTHGPEVGAIWVEVQFKNNEIMEGTIHNSVHHLVADGFFLHPSDPDSNNKLVYIRKSAIKDYRVLGIRAIANG